MREQYDEPYYLLRDEFVQIIKKDVPDTLKETKDAFLLQCAFGCRIGDFIKLTMANISATGLHEAGSSAVEHYFKLEIKDLFILMCVAFNQLQYRVDKDLNVISDEIEVK